MESESNTVSKNEFIDLSGYKVISSIENYKLKLLYYDGEVPEDISYHCGFNGKIVSLSHFDCSILLNYSFNYVHDIAPIVITEYSQALLCCDSYALNNELDIPLWLETLISSFTFADIGNERMAFFNAFSSLDQLIEIYYHSLVDVYSSFLVDIEDDEDYGDLEKEYIKKKIEKYSNDERRLIREKLKDVLGEGVSDNIVYTDLLNELYKYEKVRNNIAHCTLNYDNGSFIGLIKVIIKLIYLLGYGTDFQTVFKVCDSE